MLSVQSWFEISYDIVIDNETYAQNILSCSMKPMGPPPAFKQELRNEKIRIGDKITLTCQGENCLTQKVITDSVEQSHLLLMEAECHHFHRTLPSNLSLKQLDPAHILTLGS